MFSGRAGPTAGTKRKIDIDNNLWFNRKLENDSAGKGYGAYPCRPGG